MFATPISFDLKSVIDVLFMGIVLYTCWQNIFGAGGQAEKKAQQWKAEMNKLEATIKDLIREAGSAGSSLDRNLLQRKRELEDLVRRMDTYENRQLIDRSRERAKEKIKAYHNSRPAEPVDEFPNASWQRGNQNVSSRSQQNSYLDNLANAQQEQVTLSSRTPVNTAREVEKDLRSKIEMIRDDNKRGFKGEAKDPVAYKIAARLLNAGQEIHVVSRKLGLPVAEVRLVDSMLRGSREEEGTPPMVERSRYNATENASASYNAKPLAPKNSYIEEDPYLTRTRVTTTPIEEDEIDFGRGSLFL